VPPLPNSTETEEQSEEIASLGSTVGRGGQASFPSPATQGGQGMRTLACSIHAGTEQR